MHAWSRIAGLGLMLMSLPSPAAAQAGLEPFAALVQAPGRITVTPDERIILGPRPTQGASLAVVELFADGSTRPFPAECWSRPPGADGIGLEAVIALRADTLGTVWMVDHGRSANGLPKVVAWDTRDNRLERVIYLPAPASRPDTFVSDIAVDTVNEALYLLDEADGAHAAIVVVDARTGSARRVLEGHPGLRAENPAPGAEPMLGLASMTMDPSHSWVYLGAAQGRMIHRVRARDLLNRRLTPDELGRRVMRFGDRPLGNAMSADAAGNVFVGDVASNAVGVVAPNGRYRQLHVDAARLSALDGMSYGPDGFIYVTAGRPQRGSAIDGEGADKAPFQILRFRPLAPGVVGR